MTDPYPSQQPQQPYQEAAPAYPPQQYQTAGPAQLEPPIPTGLGQTPITPLLSDQAPPPAAPTPVKRSKLPIILAIAGVAVVVIALAVAALVWVTTRDILTREEAQRECRTALEREANRRAGQGGPDGILVSLTGVDLQETWETGSGFAVNGTARYTLTSALLPQVTQSVSLTCEATTTDGRVVTTVKNRL